MGTVLILISVLVSVYEFSFIRFCWKERNKPAIFGISILIIIAVSLSVLVFLE